MGPGGLQGKRKRGDRTYSDDTLGDGSRPSPHRPGSLDLAHQGHSSPHSYNYNYNYNRDGPSPGRGRGRGGPRSGGRGSARNSYNTPSSASYNYSRQNARPQSSGSPTAAPAEHADPPPQTAPLPETKNATPVAAASTQTPSAPVSQAPPPEPRSYIYDFVTEDARNTWKDGGRQSVVDAGVKIRDEKDMVKLAMIYQEIVRAGLDGHLGPEQAGSVVRSILEAEATVMQPEPPEESFIPDIDPSGLFIDALHMLPPEDLKSGRFKPLLFSTNISAQTMREVMDAEMLIQLGLVRSTFDRKAIRYQTNALYRQSNYNLLREETEGYSKLITELFTTSSNEPPSPEVVTGTFERVKALIGTFDLDVGRVLDIHLDVFASILVKHYRFVVKYLRISSWWPQPSPLEKSQPPETSRGNLPKWAAPDVHGSAPLTDEEKSALDEARTQRDIAFWNRVRNVGLKAFFELGGCQASPETIDAAKQDNRDEYAHDREWINTTGALPPRGNKVAAQILGFKLRFYSSDARDPNDALPHNLIALAALLIKIGFISLADLYPHIWPEDDLMGDVKEAKMKEMAERERKKRPGGSAMNALQTAGALPDDELPSLTRTRAREAEAAKTAAAEAKDDKAADGKDAEEGAEGIPEPADQKIQLLKSLLCIGAIPEALFILGKFPWLMDAFPDLPEHFHRILHYSLHKVYEPLQPLTRYPELREPTKVADLDQSGVAKGAVRCIEQPARRSLRWAALDRSDPCEETDYRFYWDDWIDNVPVCQTVEDVFQLCDTLLEFSGLKVGQDPLLLAKLTRIGIHSLATDTSEKNRSKWIAICKRLLVPALSLTKHNSCIVGEVWTLLKHFLIPVRYNIYAEWFTGRTSRLPDLQAAFDLTKAETRDVLKRISKTNIKQMARAMAKIATSSPGVVFSVALNQIESYENLAQIFVDCARYFTDLGYDVLTWSLLNSLGSQSRSHVQYNGMHLSKWLSALALLAGNVFKRYSIMNPTPVLQYVTDQLSKGNSSDLVVLEQITFSMAGIVSDATLNDAQAISMAGGPLLRQQTMLQLLDRRYEPGMHTSSKRLMRALVGPKLAGQLLVAMAQQRQICIYRVPEENAFIKVLGNMFDETHRTMTQYLDLLRSNLSSKDFDSLVPSLASLIEDYGLEPSIAFWISRPSIATAMVEHDKRVATEQERKASAEKSQAPQANAEMGEEAQSQDVTMADASAKAETPKDTKAERSGDVEMGDGSQTVADTATPQATPPESKSSEEQHPWHPVLQATMESLRSAISHETFRHLSEAFYLSFWQLSLGDLHVPTKEYDEEDKRQTRKLQEIDRSHGDGTNAGLRAKDQSKKTIVDLKVRLQAEFKDQVQSFQQIRKRLTQEKDFWFPESDNSEAISLALFEYCFIPRLTLSAVDAQYVFRVLKLLHSTGAKNFRTVKVLDELFHPKRMAALIFQFTANEAENFGRFLNDLLKFLASWHADKATYEREAYGGKQNLHGFRKNAKDDSPFMDYEEFRQLLQKWHTSLHTALKTCFSGGEYMHIRNAIVVLKAIITTFPAIDWMGKQQLKSLGDISQREQSSRKDLHIAATALLGSLKRREKEWVMTQAFSINQARVGAAGARPGRTATPQPLSTGEIKPLNPQAPTFAPSAANPTAPPNVSTPLSARTEVEDGEIPSSAKLPPLTNPFNKSSSPASRNEPQPAAREPPRSSAATAPAADASKSPSEPVQPLAKAPIPEKPTPPAPARELEGKKDLPPLQSQVNRPMTTRNVSDSHVNGRISHALPNRPEHVPNSVRQPDLRSAEKPFDRARDHRDGHYHDTRRNDWNSGYGRDQPADRQSSYGRSYDRPQDRLPPERERHDPKWAGDKLSSWGAGADDRYGSHRDSRPPHADGGRSDLRGGVEPPASRHGDPSMQPPRPIPSHADRAPLAAPSQPSERGYGPSHPDRRSDHSRLDSATHSGSQRSSRAASPTRRDERSTRPESGNSRDDRPAHDSRRPYDDAPPSRPRYDERPPPTGPRPDQRGGLSESMHATKGAPSAGPRHDYGRGRAPHESNSYHQSQESSYGRLNPPDPPSGPRAPNGHSGAPRAMRGGAAIQSQVNMPAGPIPGSMQPPTNFSGRPPAPSGPAANRNTRNTNSFSRPAPASSSAPAVPASEAHDTPGVHPDRLKAIEAEGGAPAGTRNAQAPPPAAAGPRGPAAAPPSATPNGPSERKDRRFQELKNTVEGTGPNLRSRGAGPAGRMPNGPPPAPAGPPHRDVSGADPTSYSSQRGNEPPPSQMPQPSRPDLFERAPNSSYPPAPARDDERGRGPGREMRSSRPRDDRSRSPQRRVQGMPPPAVQLGPGYQRDDLRPPPRTRASDEDLRDQRGPPPRNFSGPPNMGDGPRRSGLRSDRDDVPPPFAKERDRRDSRPERRDSGWGAAEERGPPRRDRRDEYESGEPGTKRTRGPDDGYDRGKRSRR